MHNRTIRIFLAAMAALMLSNTGAATWFAQGSFEPDNALDDPTLMRVDPPGIETNLIYFNAISGVSAGLRGFMASPNSALLQTQGEIPTAQTHMALLGVWVDCNGDGYVGMAEGALREYPSDLLAVADVCPAVSGPASQWVAGAHNYNGWVSELVPIAGIGGGGSNISDRRHYQDPAAMVWGDYNRPDDPAQGGGSCPLAPQPRGTYQSTGGFINYVDCLTAAMERWNEVWQGRRLMGQNVPGLNSFGLDLELTFADDDNATGSWADRPTFGSEDTKHSPAYVYDCSADGFRLGDELNKTPVGPLAPNVVHNIGHFAIDPRLSSDPATTWSVPAFVNHTFEGTNVSGTSVRGSANCDTSDDAGHDFYGNWATFYVGETDFNPVVGANKRESNWNFIFDFVARGSALVPSPTAGTAGYSLRQSQWNAGSVTLKTPSTARVDIAEGTYELPPAYIMTFYAHVGDATTQRGFLTPGGEGVYGKPQCGENKKDIHNGWNCDRNTWYLNPDGSPVPEPRPFARPGDPYEFRDVDCYDGSVGQTGIGIGTPYYGSEPCQPYVAPP